jgi:hypothetical protein
MEHPRHRQGPRTRSATAAAGATAALATLAAVAALIAACAATSSADNGPEAPGTGGAIGSDFGAGGSASASGGAGGALPPETEVESTYETPVATGRFVWVANPTSGRVAYIDAASLEIHTAEAGNGPTYVAPVPTTDGDAVVVLNVFSHDATVLRAPAGAQALLSQTVRGVAPGANAWTICDDGRWAIAWTDARRMPGADPALGFQDVTVIDLSAPAAASAATILAVGYRPVALVCAAGSAQALAVTQDGVSVIDLGAAAAGGPRVTRTVALTDDPTEDTDTRDVSITPDGQLALMRREGSPEVRFVDLATGAKTSVVLSGAVTDLDVSDDGARAVAVARDSAEVAIFALGAAPATATQLTLTGETIGSVVLAPGGKTALLYSNAADVERLVVLDLTAAAPTYRAIRLRGPVRSVFATPDGQNAIVVHGAPPAAPAPAPAPDAGAATDAKGDAATPSDAGAVADAGATASPVGGSFSLVPLDGTRPAKIQAADAPPQAVALSPAGDRALITARDDAKAIFRVYLALFPSLEVRTYPLASPPIAAGVVPAAGRGYVAQQHPEGRATFLSLDSGEARTLTGFELGARVVDWSQPGEQP